MTTPAYTGSKAQVLSGASFSFLGSVLAPTPAVTLGEVVSMSLKGSKRAMIMTTNMQSNQNVEKLDTTLDPGQVTVSYNRLPNDAGQNALLAAFTTGGKYSFQIQLPIDKAVGQITTGDLISFSAIITEGPLTFDINLDKAAVCDVTLEVTNAPVITPGA
jgi:hypothetical protein